MPIVTVQQSPGRTLEQRQLLIKRITEAFQEAYNLSPEAITIFLQNYDDDMWGKAGLLQADKANKPS
ncbi:MAG: 4-oxalocrotonate tautomerase [Leptolyngbyaceae cyanobacterium SM1_1_3]|nr:4-oxalocrotonate tautomerase [Leptolyngbyaceae cyanobacterium SM1_1_3]NJN02639.1 4-oxalocrotonate tautomerase [Leptolyngbyaceae cyanobacterium RM1_1_2]NJO09956.1 4-oxalocrotonate tautomerase [Leptolyngbyaceae cyanobacterium SL_1_1]